MQIVEFKNKKWIIDLDWEILPDEDDVSRKDIIKNIATKTNCNYGVFIDFDGQEAIGLAKKNSKVPSASLYLALANQEYRANTSEMSLYPDWIVIEEVGEEKYWMAVINRGIPAPQFDKILDITKIKDIITELVMVNDTYQIYSPCGEIQSIFEDMKIVENKGLNELTENIAVKNRFNKLRGIPNIVIYAGIALIVVTSAGIGINSFLESVAMQKKIQERQRQQQAERERQEAEYQVKLKLYNQEIARQITEAEDSIVAGLAGTPNKILNSWYDAVGDIQTGMHGWDMHQVSCNFSPLAVDFKSTCTLDFKRTGLSTNRMLLQEYPDANISGNNATVTRGVIADEQMYSYPPRTILKNLPDAKNWGFDMISQLQLLKIVNIDYKVASSQDIMITPPAKPLSPQEIEQNIKPVPPAPTSIGIAQGELTISGDNFDLLRELADNVSFDFVGVRSVNFKLGRKLGSIPWEIKMGYFIKTDNGGLLESDSIELSNNSIEVEPEQPLNNRRQRVN